MDSESISMWISLGLVFILSQSSAATPNNSTSTTSNDLSEIKSYSNGLDIINIQKVKDDLIQISWTVNDTALSSLDNSTRPSGYIVSYQLAYSTSKSTSPIGKQHNSTTSTTDEGLEFKSAELSPDIRSLSLHLPDYPDITICVYVLYGQSESRVTNSTRKACGGLSNWKNENKKDDDDDDNNKKEEEISDSKKLIVGVTAGCLFLIPCVFVLVLIVRKDKMMQRSAIYEELGKEHLNTGFQLGEEEKDLKKGGIGNGVRKEGGGGGGKEEGLRRLSVADLSRSQGPTVYVHTGNGDSDCDSARSDEFYVERL